MPPPVSNYNNINIYAFTYRLQTMTAVSGTGLVSWDTMAEIWPLFLPIITFNMQKQNAEEKR